MSLLVYTRWFYIIRCALNRRRSFPPWRDRMRPDFSRLVSENRFLAQQLPLQQHTQQLPQQPKNSHSPNTLNNSHNSSNMSDSHNILNNPSLHVNTFISSTTYSLDSTSSARRNHAASKSSYKTTLPTLLESAQKSRNIPQVCLRTLKLPV